MYKLQKRFINKALTKFQSVLSTVSLDKKKINLETQIFTHLGKLYNMTHFFCVRGIRMSMPISDHYTFLKCLSQGKLVNDVSM